MCVVSMICANLRNGNLPNLPTFNVLKWLFSVLIDLPFSKLLETVNSKKNLIGRTRTRTKEQQLKEWPVRLDTFHRKVRYSAPFCLCLC